MPDPYQQGVTPSTSDLLKYRQEYEQAAMAGGSNLPPYNEWLAMRIRQQAPQMAAASGVPPTQTADNGGFLHKMNLLAQVLSGSR